MVIVLKIFYDCVKEKRDFANAQLDQARLVTIDVTGWDETGLNCEVSNFGAAHITGVAPTIQSVDAGAGAFAAGIDHPDDLVRIAPGKTVAVRLTAANSFSRTADFEPAVTFTDSRGKRWTRAGDGQPKPFLDPLSDSDIPGRRRLGK